MQPYDPLDYDNLAKSVVQALLNSPEHPLPPSKSFAGAGVYAIHYRGDFHAYSRLVQAEQPPPIYVGKAVPSGARKGTRNSSGGTDLYQRLNQHAKNIHQAENLDLQHFTCRYLVVVPVWVTLAERFLIEHYRPIWNVLIEGFGDHDPGKGRRDMRRPQWDILHPGRPWAVRLAASETREDMEQRVQEFLGRKP